MKMLSPLAQQLKEYFQERYSYIELPNDEVIEKFARKTSPDGVFLSIETIGDLFQDFCLASGDYEVQE